ncbi:SDR family NAD(P)-dependent oxidoreductase [Siccirubricoccus phaeus]|uniref:SDR family NAD(P)-dependent oxidoreductase n=1 Tax=Siccirubricoccus phaeus TaxID=2595053 RepID=UPI0011F3F13E|nr:SDR family NAD(P)-dependent oxidoreductase [Siccirubricoccus phaeus]
MPEPRVALVTGAAGGIGRASALALAEAGWDVALADVREAAGAAEAVRVLGRRALAMALDVTSKAGVEAVVARILAEFGRVDALVNVAGVVGFGSAAEMPEAEWDRVLAVNLKGTFLACQAVIPAMRAQGGGRIVNIGSIIGKNGGNARPWLDRAEQQRSGSAAYGVSKAGVHALTFFLAKELAADNIAVNAVAPGPIASAMTTTFPDALKALIPVGRMGTAEEVARVVAFLAAPETGFVTGEIVDVNGGMWMD